jgi:hypothetical protein
VNLVKAILELVVERIVALVGGRQAAIESVAATMVEEVTSEVDLGDLARSVAEHLTIDLGDVAECIEMDPRDVAECIDACDVAEHVEVSARDVAEHIDLDDLAAATLMEVADEVSYRDRVVAKAATLVFELVLAAYPDDEPAAEPAEPVEPAAPTVCPRCHLDCRSWLRFGVACPAEPAAQ